MRNSLNVSARAYLDFMLANIALILDRNTSQALEYLKEFGGKYKNTPTWPRVMMVYFTICQNQGENEEALRTLQILHKRMPDKESGKRAYYHQGELLFAKGHIPEATEIFEDCVKKYKGTWLARGASQYLAKIAGMKEATGSKETL